MSLTSNFTKYLKFTFLQTLILHAEDDTTIPYQQGSCHKECISIDIDNDDEDEEHEDDDNVLG